MGSLETACGRFRLNKQFLIPQDFSWWIGFVEIVGWGFIIKKKFYGVRGFGIIFSIWRSTGEAQLLYYIKCRFENGHVGFLKSNLLERFYLTDKKPLLGFGFLLAFTLGYSQGGFPVGLFET